MRKITIELSPLSAAVLLGITAAFVASGMLRADGDPATSSIPEVIPYSGSLEMDGVAVTGAYQLGFALYQSAAGDNWDFVDPAVAPGDVMWSTTRTVDIYNGSFSVMLGDPDAGDTSLASLIADAEPLYLGIAVLDGSGGGIALVGRQLITSAPFALWSTEAADFHVYNDLTVDGDIIGNPTVRGNVDIVGTISADGANIDGPMTFGGNVNANGGVTVPSGQTLTVNGTTNLSNTTTGTLNAGSTTVSSLTVNGNQTTNGSIVSYGIYQLNDGSAVVSSNNVQYPPYHLHMTSSYGGRTVAIPNNIIQERCADADGCRVRLGMTRWDNNTQQETAARDFNLYVGANNRWRTDYGGDTTGTDGDGTTTHVAGPWDTCYFTDGVYTSWTNRGDSGVGFNLLLWNGYSGGGRTCELSIID